MNMDSVQPDNEEKETEKKLQKLTAHLQLLISSLEDIVFEIDGNQTFKNVWVNDEAILFMPKNEFLGKKVSDVMGPLTPIFTNPINEAIKTGEAREIIYKHIDSSINKWYKVKIRPVTSAEDPASCILVLSIQDITRQRLSELSLQEIKERLELSNQLLDVSQKLSQTAGWEFNPQTEEIFWTQQAYVLFDMSEDFKPTLSNIVSFFNKQDWENMQRANEDAIKQQRPYDIELRIITTKGINKWARAIGVPVIKNHEVVMITGALMDITLKKQNEIELIKAKNTAETASRAKTDFLSIMSHEIRTPLNGIIGIANLLKLDHTTEQEEYVNNLIFSADHLLQLINDILDLTKIESDRLELIFSKVNLFDLIKNIKNQFKPIAEAKNISLKCYMDDDLPQRIIADSIRLGQILNNLISNAINFTDEGEVILSISLVSVKKNKAIIHFSVKDTGIGIPEEFHESIFETFRQVQQSAYRKHSGTGLGLAITQKLAEMHNSRIFLKNNPGTGTEFYFDLSFELAKDQDTPKRASAMSPHEKKLSGLRILFVEDNLINIMLTKKQLEYFGVYPECVQSGKEALELLRRDQYDIALLDLHMPEIDGYSLARIIRQQYPDIHIIIFTADTMMDVKEKLAQMDIYDILDKPFAPQKMFEMLLKVARDKGLTGE